MIIFNLFRGSRSDNPSFSHRFIVPNQEIVTNMKKLSSIASLCCCLIVSIHFSLIQFPASPPTRGVAQRSVSGRNREAAYSKNIPVLSMLGWIEPVEPPMQGLPSLVDEV